LGSSYLRWAVVQEGYVHNVGTADKGGEPVGFIVICFRQGLFALPGIFVAQVRGWEWRSISTSVIRKWVGGWLVGCVVTDPVEYWDCVFRGMHRSMEGSGIKLNLEWNDIE